LKSVAFPAVGTGALKFPADVVADCVLAECERFSSSHPLSTLDEVRLVVFPTDQAIFRVRLIIIIRLRLFFTRS